MRGRELQARRITQYVLWICAGLVLLIATLDALPLLADGTAGARGPRAQTLALIAIVLGVLSWAHQRGVDWPADVAPLAMALAVPVVFEPSAFTPPAVPQGLWIPFVLGLCVSRLRIAVLTLLLSLGLAIWSYPGAFGQPITVIGSLIMLSLLIGGRWRQHLLAAETMRSAGALAESDAMLAAVVESMSDALVVTDSRRCIVRVNAAFESMFGYRAGDIAGRSVALLYADEGDYAQRAPRRTGDGSTTLPVVHESRYRRLDGTLFWAETSRRALLDAEGRWVGEIGLSRDVSARREAEEALHRMQRQMRTFIRHAPHAIALLDRQMNYVVTSGRWVQELGKGHADLQGLHHYDVNPGLPAERRRIHALALTGQSHFEDSDHYTCTDGSERWFRSAVLPWEDEDGAIGGLILSMEDVTAQMQARHVLEQQHVVLEQQVQQRTSAMADMQVELERRAVQAEQATRSKSEFLANMSHEIRTPMNAIIGLTRLMARDAREPKQVDRLNKVDDAARHLLHVIDDVLDLSKVESGKMVLEDVEFDADDLLSRCFEMVRGRAAEKDLELILDSGPLPKHLRGDPTRLSQMLINLLGNAVKFTERGWIRLKTDVTVDDDARPLVRFEVRDTGEGISRNRQGALFQVFEQADSSTTRRHGGSGLGLALVRHLAHLMGGEAGLSSTLGEGTAVWFTARMGQVAQKPEGPWRPLDVRRALLVDDLEESRQALTGQLVALGLSVASCPDASSALCCASEAVVRGAGFEVIVINRRATAGAGETLPEQLEEALGAYMPSRIVVVAESDPSTALQVRGIGQAAALARPVTLYALRAALVGTPPASLATRARASLSVTTLDETLLRKLHSGQRVLLAEDNPVNQEVAMELLRAVGLVVDLAVDGHRAVAMTHHGQYDLVLMDMQMPGMDGLTATSAIRLRDGAGLPILAMTANAFAEDREACLAAGMDDHIAKPVDPHRLYALLMKWLPAATAPKHATAVSDAEVLP